MKTVSAQLQNSTSDEMVIQGILKEALLTEIVFDFENGKASFNLVDFYEDAIRKTSTTKFLIFKNRNPTEKLPVILEEHGYVFSTGFYRNKISFEALFVATDNDKLIFSLPKSILITNLRTNGRSLVKQNLRRPNSILVRTKNIYCEGILAIEDTSDQGIGGTLHVPKDFPIEIDTETTGQISSSKTQMILSGHVVRATSEPSLKIEFDSYRVGIMQSSREKNMVWQARSEMRYSGNGQLLLVPLFHPDLNFTLDMIDVSVIGFSGRPAKGSTLPCLPLGTIFEIKGTTTKCKLVHFSDQNMRFFILSRTETESIKWFRTMTPLINSAASCTLREARDLYKIFLQAGAISAKYLRRHAFHKDDLISNPENFETEAGYLHRWFIKGADGSPQAHISATRFADNSWLLGDIAKLSGSELSGASLTELFFHTFARFSASMAPCPALMIMWLESHPLWKAWEAKIKARPETIICHAMMDYCRIDSTIDIDLNNGLTHREIVASNRLEINGLTEKLKALGLADFIRTALDFDVATFGSPRLTEVSQGGFFRRYFVLADGSEEFIGVFTRYNRATTFNRIPDAVYLFSLKKSVVPQVVKSVINKAYVLSLELGLEIPSVRYVFKDSHGSLDPASSMKCYLLTHDGFLLFKGFK